MLQREARTRGWYPKHEVASENRAEFEKVMARIDLAVIGEVTDGEVLEIYGVKDEKKVAASIGELKEAWQRPLRW